jgi:cholesterol transport system auxiliary component
LPIAFSVGWLALLLAGCSLPIKPEVEQTTYRLNPPTVLTAPLAGAATEPKTYLIEVRPIQAAEGFQTPQMMYSTQAQLLLPYRENRWLAPPAALLTDSIAQVLTRQPWVAAVVSNSARAPVALGISCNLTRLEHDMANQVGQAHLVMSCLWTNPATRTVLAHWRFDQTQAMPENDAMQFAAASQTLVNAALTQLVEKTRALVASERLVP